MKRELARACCGRALATPVGFYTAYRIPQEDGTWAVRVWDEQSCCYIETRSGLDADTAMRYLHVLVEGAADGTLENPLPAWFV